MRGRIVELRPKEDWKAYNGRLEAACSSDEPAEAELSIVNGSPVVLIIPVHDDDAEPIQCRCIPLVLAAAPAAAGASATAAEAAAGDEDEGEEEEDAADEAGTPLEQIFAKAFELAGDDLLDVQLRPIDDPQIALIVWATPEPVRPAIVHGNVPFGYRKVHGRPVIDPEEAEQVLAVLHADATEGSRIDALRPFDAHAGRAALLQKAVRIMKHVDIYRYGRFVTEGGAMHDFPELVIADDEDEETTDGEAKPAADG